MESFNSHIRNIIRQKNSLVCVGLDTDSARLPRSVVSDPDAVLTFNREIIDATSDLVAAYKPNLAFYEALGSKGLDILEKTLALIPDNILKIGDAKRGDIGNTAQKYADALFNTGFDVVTVNPYMGVDAILPFTQNPQTGVFILCLTSNAGSENFQRLESGGRPIFIHVAEEIVRWNENDNCGLVVGATHPDDFSTLRKVAGRLPFLIPGIGAQGGDLRSAVLHGTDALGEMALINSSRGILYASSGSNFAEAAREKTLNLRDAINQIRKNRES